MSNLYKLIIVDDEFFIRDGLSSYDWERLGFQVVGTAANGNEALNLMEEFEADLIITDIKMPIMDGLKLSKIIKERYPQSKIVILTGYKEFEYIKESLQTGVMDYLLKPVEFSELDQLAQNIKGKLDEEQKSIFLENIYKKKLEESIPIAIDTFIRDMVTGRLTDFIEIQEKMSLFEISLKKAYYNCSIIRLEAINSKVSLEPKAVISIYNKIKQYLGKHDLGYVYFDYMKNEFILLINYDSIKTTTTSELLNILEQIKSLVLEFTNETLDLKFFLGAGNVYSDLFALPISYKEASEVINKKFFVENKDIFLYQADCSTDKSLIVVYPYEKEAALLTSIFDGNITDSTAFLHEILSYFDSCFIPFNSSEYKKMLIQLLTYIDRKLASNNLYLQEIAPGFATYNDAIQFAPTLSKMKDIFENLILTLVNYIKHQNSQQVASSINAIKQAINYVNAHYNEKITLVSVAEKVYLTPNYFSAQFKKHTGKNFVDYVKHLRIKKSKELLSETSLKVYEISELVGYENPKYFTDVFKDFTGISPLEFRQKSVKILK